MATIRSTSSGDKPSNPTCHDAREVAVSEPEIRENARKALEDHAWQDAYEAYISLRDHEELTGKDWAGFAEAAWWSAHPNESLLLAPSSISDPRTISSNSRLSAALIAWSSRMRCR